MVKKLLSYMVKIFGLVADAPYEDLVKIDQNEHAKKSQQFTTIRGTILSLFQQDVDLLKERQEYEATGGYVKPINYFQIPGKVLHLDGDPRLFKKMLVFMKKLEFLYRVSIVMKRKCRQIGQLIDYYRPDILVITGHDAYSKAKGKMTDINAYRHSKHFVQTVREAEKNSSSRSTRYFCRSLSISL